MGDVVHALPALCALRQKFPLAQLSWLVDPRFAAILDQHPAIDHVIVPPSSPFIARWPRSDLLRATVQYAIAHHLRRENYDLVIDLQGLFRTGVLTAATGARRRIGFANAREGAPIFYTHRHHIPRELHAVDRCLQLVGTLGAAGPIRYDLSPTPSSRDQACQLLKKLAIDARTPYLVISPRSANPIKEWPAERFAELAREINRTAHLPVVLIGTRADEPLARQIADQAGEGTHVLTGTPLAVSMALIAGSRLMVANDSGPLHLAVALGRPVVGIYGPTDPIRTGPYGHADWVVRDNSSCEVCRRPRWRVPGHTCLTQLSVDRVLSAVKQRLG
ncbi:MAG: lipopolysaccharide heptosyltransferase I [Phycisphaerales bacterium]|nr:lipopolysaccharide heptosyltransferase I [Phycisphaerales bacterium]